MSIDVSIKQILLKFVAFYVFECSDETFYDGQHSI